jgi:glycosyltransferase involved in cell wall biosynthesis
MRIAQVAPLFESVPPAGYGGTERVVHWLTEELVAAGHDVTLFASADSMTSAKLVPCCRRALRLAGVEDEITPHVLAIERAARGGFDFVHFHTGTLHMPLARRMTTPNITTMHGRLDTHDMAQLMREFQEIRLVSISDQQREPLPWARWVATVHHGLPVDMHPAGPGGGGYLAFLGRISHEKRPDRAIEIARRARLPLKIAAKIGANDRRYFEREIRPMIEGDVDVEFLGEVDDDGKQLLLGGAVAMLFPIDWPEPFGLAMIESLACGTPVIAWRAGSVPSIIEEGRTGFVVDDIDQAVAGVHAAERLSRAEVRRAFEERFTARRMAADYVRVYESVAGINATAWRST